MNLLRSAGSELQTQKISPSTKRRQRVIANVRGRLVTIRDNKQLPRIKRDLAAAAFKLVKGLDETIEKESKVIERALSLAWEAIETDQQVEEIRDAFEDLVDDRASVDVLHDRVGEYLRSMNIVPLAPAPRSPIALSPPPTSVSQPPSPHSLVVRPEKQQASTSQTVTNAVSARIVNESAGHKMTIHKGAYEKHQYGHEIVVGPNRILPGGDYSVHDRQQNVKYENRGEVDIQFGGNLIFK